MTNRVLTILTALLILLSLLFLFRTALPNGSATQADDLTGPLLVWHSWLDDRAAVLAQARDKFQESHPDVRIVLVGLPQDELYARYAAAAINGFGPDLLIGPDEWLPDLLAGGLVRPVDVAVEAQSARWFPEDVRRTLRSQQQLYGLPFALRTRALFYNKDEIDSPASTLDELLAQAGAGAGVGIGTSFEDALWGLGSSGGHLYDEKGNLMIDVAGLGSWLTWLRNAQNNPAFVMSTNQEGLRELFATGELAYLVDESTSLGWLSDTMSKTLGVRVLPAGPGGNATPLLHTDAIFFNPASSTRQQKAANSLALFLTGQEQQTLFMRRAGIVPAHQSVRINSRLNPEISAFAAQSKTAIPWNTAPPLAWLLKAGDEAYIQTLEGVLSPSEAAADLAERLAESIQQTGK